MLCYVLGRTNNMPAFSACRRQQPGPAGGSTNEMMLSNLEAAVLQFSVVVYPRGWRLRRIVRVTCGCTSNVKAGILL